MRKKLIRIENNTNEPLSAVLLKYTQQLLKSPDVSISFIEISNLPLEKCMNCGQGRLKKIATILHWNSLGQPIVLHICENCGKSREQKIFYCNTG